MGFRNTMEILGHVGVTLASKLTRLRGRNVENVEFHCQDTNCRKDITNEGGVVATGNLYCLPPQDCSVRGQREVLARGKNPESQEYRKKDGLMYALQTGALTFYEE